MNKNNKNESFIYSLIKDYWLDFKKDDPDLSPLQKNRWYYLFSIILSECALATLVFYASITFAAFIGAIEIGSTVLFVHYFPILAGLIFAILVVDVLIKFLTDRLTKDWRYYVYKSETKRFGDLETLKKYDQRDKSIISNSPGPLARTLAICVSDLLEAATTIITAIIQFIPCILILYLISPPLPIITFFICFTLLFSCYQVAKVMNDSQATYMTLENQFLTDAESVTSNAQSLSMQPELLNSRVRSLYATIDNADEARNKYTVDKSIFNFFAMLAEKIVLFGPYLFFGYYAIQAKMSMAEFTLMVNTFIQASTSLMKINQIQSLLVKCNNAKDLYKAYNAMLESKIQPNIYQTVNEESNVTFNNAKIFQIETTAPYNIRIVDKNGSNIVEKFDKQELKWETQDSELLNNQYCLSPIDKNQIMDPILFNKNHLTRLKPEQEYVFSDKYIYNYALDFSIPLGKKVLIKGDSGTGKSLIIKAISGNYRLGYGSLSLPDDSRILHVPQVSDINVSGTWSEELLASMPNEEKNRVNSDDMLQLAQHYFATQKGCFKLTDTIGNLSGGQKQRFILCRVLLRNPENIDLITLDEPFGAVDSVSEYNYLKDIYTKFKRATILTITHSDIDESKAPQPSSILALHNAKISLTSNSMFKQQKDKVITSGEELSNVCYSDLKV